MHRRLHFLASALEDRWPVLSSTSHLPSDTGYIFVLIHKATTIDKPQLGFMVISCKYKKLKLYKTLYEGIRKWEG